MRRLKLLPNGSRHGVVIPLAAVLLTLVFAFAALTVDVGYITITKGQLQRCADAAALDVANRLRDNRRAASGGLALEVADEARRSAALTAAANPCAGIAPELVDTDVTIGRLLPNGEIDTSGDPRLYNAARVRVRRDSRANGSLRLFFAPLLGVDAADLSAEATAALEVTARGFQPPWRQPSSLIPFAIHIDTWEQSLAGGGRDDYAWDEDAQSVRYGADGAAELDIFTEDEHAPGNFGTLRIGRDNNGMGQLLRQITDGVGRRDLNEYGGKLDLGDDGAITVSGDPGLGGPIYAAAASIIGKPVSIAVFSDVAQGGAQAEYRVVGFVGVQIVSVRATDSGKHIRIQPTLVRDETAIPGETGEGRYIYGAVRLVQ